MSNTSEESQERILELLRSLPHPGEFLIDAVGEGISGLYLRPKSLPQKLDTSTVPLRIMQGEKSIDNDLFVLNLDSRQWQEWVEQRPKFVIRAEDVGNDLSVVKERERNFIRNLLHEFLDQITIKITIHQESERGLQDMNEYSRFFWDKALSISGSSYYCEMAPIQATISSVEAWPAIEVRNSSMFFQYWRFLPESDMPKMKTLLKWHRALVCLQLLIVEDNVYIPIDFEELKRTCREEVKNAFAVK